VTVGDRFTRAHQPSKIYVVTKIDERAYCPPHARLVALNATHEQITIAVGTLQDRRFFLPGPPDPPAWKP